MSIKNSLFFRNVSRCWKNEVSDSEQVIFLSPYITSGTAETVLLSNSEVCGSIYTCFDAENFVCKASSLKTLKKLLNKGCLLFHIENLHAKVMLTNNFISIGSQNLTNKGASNKEATFCSNDEHYIKYGHEAVATWIEDAEEITLEMIEDMEELIAPYVKEFEKIKCSLEDGETLLAAKAKIRRNQALQDRKAALRRKVQELEKSSHFVYAWVKHITNIGEWNETSTYSLVPDKPSNSFCRWYIGGIETSLIPKQRYLLMDIESAKVGWARVNEKRITFISDGVSSSEFVTLGGWIVQIVFEANWSSSRTEYNLTVKLKYHHSVTELVYRCYFDLAFISDLRLDEERSTDGFEESEEFQWNSRHLHEFEKCIAKQLLSPFVYNQRLTGFQANEFFGDSKSHWKKVSLATLRGHSILISEPYT